MDDWRLNRGSLSEKYEYYWKQNVETEGDIIFLVGPEEEKVMGFKTILKVISPVFEVMLNDRWTKPAEVTNVDHQVGHLQEHHQLTVRLPHLEPGPFRHFLPLLLKDTTTTAILNDLGLTLKDVLQLFLMCKEFLVPSLGKACEDYIRKETRVDTVLEIYEFLKGKDEVQLELDCYHFICRKATEVCQQKEWLTLSKETIGHILAADSLIIDELDLFTAACRWAKSQGLNDRYSDAASSSTNSMDTDADPMNLRNVLGDDLFHIRFPLMSAHDFAKFVRPSNILLDSELVAIYDHLVLGPQRDEEKVKVLQFRCDRRSCSNRSLKTLQLASQMENRWLECADREQFIWFRATSSIKIHSFGFLGPTLGDSVYDVMMSVKCQETGRIIGKSWTNVFAKEMCPFWVPFGNPVKIEQNQWYHLSFVLKGSPTGCTDCGTEICVMGTEEVTFQFRHVTKMSHMHEIRYSK